MKNWLVKMAQQHPSHEEKLAEAIESLSPEDLQSLATDLGMVEPSEPSEPDLSKYEQADTMGRELAHIHGDELEKQAILGGLLAGGARLLGSGGAKALMGAGNALGAAGSAVSGARAMQGAPSSGGGFKYASQSLVDHAYDEFLEKQAMGAALLGKGLSLARRNPRAALAMGGAAVGAAGGLLKDPGYDERGNHRSRLGAAAKGAIGGGVIGGAVGSMGAVQQGVRSAAGGMRSSLQGGGMRNMLGAESADKALGSFRDSHMGARKAGLDRAAKLKQVAEVAPQQAPAIAPAQQGAPPIAATEPTAAPQTMTPEQAQGVASNVASSESGLFNRMSNMVRGRKSLNVDPTLQDPGQIKVAFSQLSPGDRIKVAFMLKQAMFSMSGGNPMKGLMGGGGGAAVAKRAVPPPIPAAARTQASPAQRRSMAPGSAFAAPAGPSPYAAPAKPNALAGVNKQLSGARSIAGGGLPGGRPAQITAMPGSGW